MHGMPTTVGEVDHERNGFNPSDIVTDFDYGRVSELENGQTLREYNFVAVDKHFEVVPGIEFSGLAFNGRIPGPTIRCTEGDRIRIHFTNGSSHPHTIHFHGMHVPPTGRADNSWLHVPPGETFIYEFEVPRGGAGTYWYHPHAHGTLARQLWAGLSGQLVVDGPLERMPELAAVDERIVLLRDLALDEQGRPVSARASLADFVWGTPALDDTPVYPSLGASLTDRPENGTRATICPSSRRPSQLIRERSMKSTEKPSPFENHFSEPNAIAPSQVTPL